MPVPIPPLAQDAPSSRPRWAIEWSMRTRSLRSGSDNYHSRSRDCHSQPGMLGSQNDYSSRSDWSRPSSRLSCHLNQEEQQLQALSNDAAQRQALPISRRDDTDTVPTCHIATSTSGWEEGTTMTGSTQPQGSCGIPSVPRFQPSKVHAEMLKRESIRGPVFGGRSKNQQLGSVAESWGAPPALEIPKGMFELDDDPPSPTEGIDMTPSEMRAERARRAALGIPAEKSGRPSIKDMEQERYDKLKQQQLRVERLRNDITPEQDRRLARVLTSTDPPHRMSSISICTDPPTVDDGW